ncbi:hypothetical protein Tco_0235906 [Tanacetum coccineum]
MRSHREIIIIPREIKRDQFMKECDLRGDLARKTTIGQVEFLEVNEVEEGAVRMDGTFQHSATNIQADNVTSGVVASNPLPFTTICTCVPAHHYWITRTGWTEECVVDG